MFLNFQKAFKSVVIVYEIVENTIIALTLCDFCSNQNKQRVSLTKIFLQSKLKLF